MLGRLGADGLDLREVHRFRYEPRERDGHLRWDFDLISRRRRAGAEGRGARPPREAGERVRSLGVDSWAVDYALFDADGRAGRAAGLLPRRADERAPWTRCSRVVPREEIFARTGIQFLAFNTLFQLAAHVREGLPATAPRACS